MGRRRRRLRHGIVRVRLQLAGVARLVFGRTRHAIVGVHANVTATPP